ncbi:hypothetical protein SFRURICE_005573 [Spodoptera frugiperda]|nr:hypothetical protein SFRURICE_005573 [Spodoptera frugiperda]
MSVSFLRIPSKRREANSRARMTSTSFNVGLADNTRLSSRVLRPPGGGHTDIFGGEPEPQQTHRRGPPASTIGSVVGQEEPKPANGTDASSQNGQKSPQEAAPAPVADPLSPRPPAQWPRRQSQPRLSPPSVSAYRPAASPRDSGKEAPHPLSFVALKIPGGTRSIRLHWPLTHLLLRFDEIHVRTVTAYCKSINVTV